MSSESFLKRVLADFAESLQPLREAVSSPDAFAAFLGQFGWTLASADLEHVRGSLNGLSNLSDNPSALDLAQLTDELITVGKTIRTISTSGAPAALASTFPRELLDYLVYVAVAQQAPPLFGILHFVGVLSERRVAAAANTGRAEYIQRQVHWDRLAQLADQPSDTVAGSYGWGGTFDPDAFLRSLGVLAVGFGARAGLYPADRRLVDQYYEPGAPDALGVQNLILSLPGLDVLPDVQLAFLALPIPPRPDVAAPPDGLALMPVITGQASDSFTISPEVLLKLGGDFLARPIRAEVHPGHTIVRASGADTHVGALARLDAKSAADAPWRLVGDATSSRFEVSAVHVTLSMSGELDGDLDLGVEIGIDTAALVIDLSEGDDFLQETISSQPTRSRLSFVLKWSSKSGFSLGGQPRLQLSLPMHQSIGDIASLDAVNFALGEGSDKSLELDATVNLSASIGPVSAAIADVGLRVALALLDDTDPPGNLGNLDSRFGFKPPAGAGLAIDVAGVTGGGFLYMDEAKGQYAGVVLLTLEGGITLKALGLITTRLPNGAKGFSFLVMITAEGFDPIPLGLGFTLTRVGGLLAVNRTCNEDVLREGLKNNTLNDLLFPTDPVRNAMQIFGTLNNVFPPRDGSYLFGPVVQICWFTPPLLTMDLALILELGNRTRLVILGRISAILPNEQDDLLRLQLNALGVIDFDQKTIALDATLYDSRLVHKFPLTGNMALRLSWGASPSFALSIGGFHPAFNPPSGFPALQRITLSLSDSPSFRLRCDAYFAITANTLQFGAHAELVARAGGFSVEGHIGFDVLVQFDPFGFVADFEASVQLKHGSTNLFQVKVAGELAGPRPLHVKGKATFSILWCDFSVHFDQTLVSGELPPPPEPVDVLPRLKAALDDPRNWSGALADGDRRLVSLRAGQPADQIALHPLGRLSVKQKVVPLGVPIARFGNAQPADARLFTISPLSVNGKSVALVRENDFFAPAQFLELSDDEKLAAPSFEPMPAGVSVGTGGSLFPTSDDDLVADDGITFETIVVDSEHKPAPTNTRYTLTAVALGQQLRFGAAANSAVRRTGTARYQVGAGKNAVAKKGWTLVSAADGTAQAALGLAAGQVTSYAESFQAVERAKAQNASAGPALLLVRVSVAK